MPHVGHADSITNNERGSRSKISDWSSSNPITRVIKVTLPNPHYPLYEHSFIHARIHSFHTSKSIAYAVKCITTLRVASRSGSCLIQQEQRSTGVRRPAHEGLEATWHQTEPGEKTQMSLERPRVVCPKADRVISTFSFDPNLEPCP